MNQRYAQLLPASMGGSGQCSVDGMQVGCALASTIIGAGAGAQCPDNDCTPRGVYSRSQGRYVGIALWDPNAAEAGVGISSKNGAIVRNSSNAGWITAGINFVGNGITGPGWSGGTEFVKLNFLPDESGAYLVDAREPAPQPQRPTPLTPYDFNERVRWNELITQSFLDAANALLKDGNCRKALGMSKSGVNSLIRALLKNADTGMLAFGTVAITVGRGKSAAVYFGSSFFNDSTYKLYDYGPRNARQWRALTVLHEIAHAQNKIPDDAGDFKQNTANDKQVLAECMKGIGSVPREDPPNIPPPR